MTDRRRREAVKAFRSALESAVGCIAIVKIQGGRQEGLHPSLLAFETPGESVQLRPPSRLRLRVRLRARVGPSEADPERWQARIVAYQYTLLDRDEREYLGYHWHPDGISHETEPHLHLGPAARVGASMLATAHLPTGAISLAAVVRLAIEAFGARPLRPDWSAVLSRVDALASLA